MSAEQFRAVVPSDAFQYLEHLTQFGVKLGLENILGLMERAGNPHLRYPVIHIAGTNGKGSVAAFLHHTLHCAGYRVGCFTSPHLLRVNERFQVNEQPITDEALERLILRFRTLAQDLPVAPTFFECNTAIAFEWFAEQQVDVAVVEVGLGGRFDSTNIVKPCLSVITNIEWDHMEHLGHTLAQIAFEKAGIIKPGVVVVTGETKAEPLAVIEQVAAPQQSPLRRLNRDFFYEESSKPWSEAPQTIDYRDTAHVWEEVPVGLAGVHQQHNAAVALAALSYLNEKFPKVTVDVIREAFRTVSWPGRLQRVLDVPPVYLDAAHNTAGIRALGQCFQEAVVLFAVSKEKQIAEMLDAAKKFAQPLIVTQYTGRRALPVQEFKEWLPEGGAIFAENLAEGLRLGISSATVQRPLLITGSIYALGEVWPLLVKDYGAKAPPF